MNFHFWVNYLIKTTKHFRVQECVFESSIFLVSLGPDKAFKSFPALHFWFDCIV